MCGIKPKSVDKSNDKPNPQDNAGAGEDTANCTSGPSRTLARPFFPPEGVLRVFVITGYISRK